MSKVQKKPARRSKRRTTVARVSPASLPPQGPGVDADTSTSTPVSSTEVTPVPKKPFWDVGKDSVIYERAMKVLAMRMAGIGDKDIADTMGLSMQTIWNYCYIAGKNEWVPEFGNAKDQIEFRILPKVVRNLEAALDDNTRHVTSGLKVKDQVALQIAEGTVFKKFEQADASQAPISNIIAIRIEQVGGGTTEVREGNIGGVPAYVEGEVDDALRQQ